MVTIPKGKMITNSKGDSYYKKGKLHIKNNGWFEHEISKEEWEYEVEIAKKELEESNRRT